MEWILAISLVFGMVACHNRPEENAADKASAARLEILAADKAFSAMSEAKGLRAAFMEYIDSNGVLLRPGTLPMVAGDAMDFITQSNDSGFVMSWQPKSATVAVSGELGYTYGIYGVRPADADTIIYGSYITVWKKQPGGKWKFVMQSGNEGLE